MKKIHFLLAFVGIIAISVITVGLTNYKYDYLAINFSAATSAHHFTIDKDTTIVKGSTSSDYTIPRGEGTDDDIRCRITNNCPTATTFQLNYKDSFFFVPDFYHDNDSFEFWFGINNLVHFRINYYVSVNDSDNSCKVKINLYGSDGSDIYTFIDTDYGTSKGDGFYEWNRPEDAYPSIKASSLFIEFYHFRGTPTFRVNPIEFDWIC